MFLQKTVIPASKMNQNISKQKLKTDTNYDEAERELNSKIMNITMKINDHFPELSRYLEEMPLTIPVDKKPENTLQGLSTYYNSLNVLLNHYKKEHPQISTQ